MCLLRDQNVSFVSRHSREHVLLPVCVCLRRVGGSCRPQRFDGVSGRLAACGGVVYRRDWCCACGEAWHEQHSQWRCVSRPPLPPLRSSNSNMLPCMHVTLVCERLTDALCHSLPTRVGKGTTHIVEACWASVWVNTLALQSHKETHSLSVICPCGGLVV